MSTLPTIVDILLYQKGIDQILLIWNRDTLKALNDTKLVPFAHLASVTGQVLFLDTWYRKAALIGF